MPPQPKKRRSNAIAAASSAVPPPNAAVRVRQASPGGGSSSVGRIRPSLAEPKGGRSRRSLLTAAEKVAVLDWYNANGRNQKHTAAHFRALPRYDKLSQGTISRWLLTEPKIRASAVRGATIGRRNSEDMPPNGRLQGSSPAREKSLRHPELEKCLTLWLDGLELAQCARLSGREIKTVANQIYDELKVPRADRLELSNGWLGRFQARHGLKLHKGHSEGSAACVQDALEMERRRLADVVSVFLSGKSGRSLNDVWNMDETSFFFDCSPIIVAENAVNKTATTDTKLTAALAVNATGTERLEPLFIGQGSQLQLLGFRPYYINRLAVMTADIFSAWLQTWDQELVAANRQVLLLVDQARGHLTDLANLSNIQLEFFSPLLTGRVQPCCLGLSSTFHTLYRRSVVMRAVEKLSRRAEASTDGGELFEIDQLEAMNLVKTMWQNVKAEVIVSCWRKAQLLPDQIQSVEVPSQLGDGASVAMTEEVAELQQALHFFQMEAQARNVPLTCMNATEFSRFGLEEAACTGLSIKDIVQLVVKPEIDQSNGLMEGVELSNAGLEDTSVSAKRLLQAQLTLERYWQQNGFELTPKVLQVLQQSRTRLQQLHNDHLHHGYTFAFSKGTGT
ncbi:hypothetical protein BBJ28_00019322 [Nothophytophthora sp. Chile5]|nr:hypothetical protein BBJ28_00019322 [Nothophytophthora sp. Chile5]